VTEPGVVHQHPAAVTEPEPALTDTDTATETDTLVEGLRTANQATGAGLARPRGNARRVRVADRAISVLNVVSLSLFAIGAVGELVVMIANIYKREVLNAPYPWVFEVADLAMPLMVFVGGAWSYAADRQIRFDVVARRLRPNGQRALDAFADGWVLVTAVAVVKLAWPKDIGGEQEKTATLHIPEDDYTYLLILGMIVLAVYCVLRLARHAVRDLLGGAAVLAAWAAFELILWATLGGTQLNPSSSAVWVIAVTFAGALVMGVPIAFVLLSSSLLYLGISGAAPLDAIPIALVTSTQNFVNLAIPFFIMAGILLTYGGLTTKLTAFVESLVGRIRGGLLHAVVVSMYLFSGLSGSKVADVAAVGSALREGLAEEGYSEADAAAVLAASAVMGESIPPSLVMLILGSVTSISISDLFLGGVLPAALVGLMILGLIFFTSPKRSKPAPLGVRRRVLLGVNAVPALIVPVVLIGGIIEGIASPTEVSAVAVAMALVLLLIFRRSAKPLLTALTDTCGIGGMVLMIVSSASAFSYALTIAGFPGLVNRVFAHTGDNRAVILIATIVIVPIIGMVLEGAPAVLVLAPLLVPIATSAGINPVQYGIVFVLSIGLGTYAPPMGVGLYAVCAVTGARVGAAARRLAPYWATILVAIVLIAAVPAISLWLPHLTS
jgi:tripartite ATP-independent transporter DctM subunit